MDRTDALLDQEELMPGDVLLYHRSDLLGRVMQAFDGADVCHAALYVGDGAAESIRGGLVRRSLAVSLGDHPGDHIAVYRWSERGRLPCLSRVMAVATRYLAAGPGYAYSEVALLALLALTRKVPLATASRVLVRLLLDRAAAGLLELTRWGTVGLTCSEFVFRCFVESRSAAPRILPLARVDRALPCLAQARASLVTANFVSPGDFARSPSLCRLGRLRCHPARQPLRVVPDALEGDPVLAHAARTYLARVDALDWADRRAAA